MMIAGPDPDYADCVMSQETTVADYTSPHTPPRVRVRVGNVECTELVDTGSRANLISQELYDFIANDEEYAQPGIHGQLETSVERYTALAPNSCPSWERWRLMCA